MHNKLLGLRCQPITVFVWIHLEDCKRAICGKRAAKEQDGILQFCSHVISKYKFS